MRQERTRLGWPIWLALGLLLVVAVLLRWLYIRGISYFFDEFVSVWAARTVLQRGLPLLPPGNFYSHGMLFTYLEAPFFWLFGLNEPLLRLPSLLIGTGTVVAIFFVARSFFSDDLGVAAAATAGLVAAAGVALDPEAVAWGGRVRMYALLQLLVLLAVYVFYRASIAEDRPGLRWLALGLLWAAMLAQAQAALLMPAFALSLLAARGVRWSLRPSVVGPFLLAGAGFAAIIYGLPGEASHLQGIHQVRPYLALPTGNLLGGVLGFAPAFVDLWRLPYTLPAVGGLVYLFRRPGRRSPWTYLYLVFVTVLFELFFLAGPTWQTPRYAFMVLPLLWLIGGGVVARWLRRLRSVWWGVGVTLGLAAFIGVTGCQAAFTQEWGYDRAFRYLQQVVQPGDAVLTTNPSACALYLDQCDYYALEYGYEEYVLSPEGTLVDRWTGAPLLNTVEQLRQVLSTSPRVFFVVDGWRFQSRFKNEFIRTVLDQMRPIFDERGALVFLGEGYAERPPPAISRPLAANFGELALEGYELSSATLQPGGQLEVSLAWRAGEDPRTAYVVFLHLVGADGVRVAQFDEPLLGGYYQPTVWPPDEAVTDRHLLALPDDLQAGRYRLEMGLYRPDSQDVVPRVDTAGDRVVLDYLETEGMPASAPQVPVQVNFGGQVELLGYTLACQPPTCDVKLYWRATDSPDADYTVFTHLVGEDGQIVGQHDGMPVQGFYPMTLWEAGEVVEDEHPISLTAGTPAGDYQLLVGLYRQETRERLPVLAADGHSLGDSVVLATIPIQQ